MPHLGRDPVVAAAHRAGAAAPRVAREVDPIDRAVILGHQDWQAATRSTWCRRPCEMLGPCGPSSAETQAIIERRMGEVMAGIAAHKVLEAKPSTLCRGYPRRSTTRNSEAQPRSRRGSRDRRQAADDDRRPGTSRWLRGFCLHARAGRAAIYGWAAAGRRGGSHLAQSPPRLRRRQRFRMASATGRGWSNGCCPRLSRRPGTH